MLDQINFWAVARASRSSSVLRATPPVSGTSVIEISGSAHVGTLCAGLLVAGSLGGIKGITSCPRGGVSPLSVQKVGHNCGKLPLMLCARCPSPTTAGRQTSGLALNVRIRWYWTAVPVYHRIQREEPILSELVVNFEFHPDVWSKMWNSQRWNVTFQVLLREAVFPSVLHIKFWCSFVCHRNNWFLRRGTEGGFTAAVYWCFALLILKVPKVNSSQVKLAPGISLFRAPVWSCLFSATCSRETVVKMTEMENNYSFAFGRVFNGNVFPYF